MINKQLLNPNSIVVVGASNNIQKPGGKVLKNLIDGNYKGDLYVTNLKENNVQGIKSFNDINQLPDVDLAIIAIAAKFCIQTVKILAETKKTKAFIIISAGFSEIGNDGKKIENEVVSIINKSNGVLIGPNGIGVLTPQYHGVFTEPIPKLSAQGCDFISGSGATAVFILESGIARGLTFANIFSVGNSAQLGVEEILKYMDETFDPKTSSKVKLLYLENIDKPQLLLKHAASLVNKGCKIAAIKAGSSDAGSRAASSHTGALASSDLAVDALFKKAGIVRCYSRQELVSVASVFMHPELKGKNIAVITHAGGPAVILTDTLSKGGLNVPVIDNDESKKLLAELFPGSSVSNPIDFLATGTAEQLGIIIDYVDNKFNDIDAMVVIFGTPGLVKVFDAYDVLNEKMKTSKKPIFPVLPSRIVAKEEVDAFLSKKRVFFPDEAILASALSKIFYTPKPSVTTITSDIDKTAKINKIIKSSDNGYMSPDKIQELLDIVEIPRAKEGLANNVDKAIIVANDISYPLVMKVVGPVHKSDLGGVVLNVKNQEQMIIEFNRLMKIEGATSVLFQPLLNGTELFVGAKYEDKFGHIIMCGLGGIFIEVLKDFSSSIVPVSKIEAVEMIHSLRSYDLIKGVRGQKGVNEHKFADILCKLSELLIAAPEIKELDINPLLGTENYVLSVDARIRIEK